MSRLPDAFNTSIGRKLVMGLTGLFLISFLLVHVSINSLVFANDGGLKFNTAADFMANNILIRIMEVGLIAGFIVHIYQAAVLSRKNDKSRPIKYAVSSADSNSKWYSRSMGLLGTIILIFLIVHLGNFWVKSRFTNILVDDSIKHKDLYAMMHEVFQQPFIVALYVFAMFSLGYHLLHGFSSAFQTLGLSHKKYTPLIKFVGVVFSLIVPLVFAAMPLAIYLHFIK